MRAGADVEFEAVPGADDVRLRLGERHALAGLVLGDDLLDLGDHLALTDRSAHVWAQVEIGVELAVELEHPDLEVAEADDFAAGIRKLRRGADIHLTHALPSTHRFSRLNHIDTSERLRPTARISALTVTTISVGVTRSGATTAGGGSPSALAA